MGGGVLALLLTVFFYLFSRDGGGGVRVWLLFTPASLQMWLDSGRKGHGGEPNRAVGRQTLSLGTRCSPAGQTGHWVGERSPALLGTPSAAPSRSATVAS